jgi:hypothetical protein
MFVDNLHNATTQKVSVNTSVEFEVLAAVNMEITIFWDVRQYSPVESYQSFERISVLSLQRMNSSNMKMDATDSSEASVTLYQTTLSHVMENHSSQKW